jgi:hypothetical protein
VTRLTPSERVSAKIDTVDAPVGVEVRPSGSTARTVKPSPATWDACSGSSCSMSWSTATPTQLSNSRNHESTPSKTCLTGSPVEIQATNSVQVLEGRL